MPKLRLAQQPAQKCLYKACVRILRGFDSLTGGQGSFWRVRWPENACERFRPCNGLH